MQNKKIVVTGGAGFIGSHITQRLAKEEYDNEIIVIDNLSTGKIENINNLIEEKKINFYNNSIIDLSILQNIFGGVDYVFHEAAIPSVPRSIKDPLTSNEVNVKGTLNVLIAARNNNVKKVIYASSSSVYGDSEKLPKKENMKPSPLSPYAVSKLVGELYCKVFCECYNLQTVSLRYFNVYGARQNPLSEYSAVIPKFIYLITNNENPIIFGDGNQTRDFTFVEDIVDANILAAEKNANGIFNIAGGKQITINDLAYQIIRMCSEHIEPIHQESRQGDILHSLADISKAKRQLKYEPKFNLERGLRGTINASYRKTYC